MGAELGSELVAVELEDGTKRHKCYMSRYILKTHQIADYNQEWIYSIVQALTYHPDFGTRQIWQ